MASNKRDSAKKSIAKAHAFITSTAAEEATLEMITTYYERLQEQWTRFQQLHEAVLEVTGEKGLELQQIELDTVEDLVMKSISIFKAFIKNKTVVASVVANAENVVKHTEGHDEAKKVNGFRIPKFKLPLFTGNFNDWPAFRDLFIELIDKNDRLTDLEKLGLLKTNVEGEALKLIKNLKLTSDQYAAAWVILRDRYENERVLVHHLQVQIYSIPLSKGKSDDIKKLLDETNQAITALKNQNRDVDSYDDWLVFLVEIKLDAASKARWEEFLEGDNSVPSWDQMNKFLKARFRALAVAQASDGSNEVRHTAAKSTNTPLINTFHVNETSESTQSCRCCLKTNHRLHSCFKFLKKSLPERQSLVHREKLCTICLKPNHTTNSCYSKNICSHCQKRHHTLLHDKARGTKSNHSKRSSKTTDVIERNSSSSDSSASNLVLHVGNSIHRSHSVLLATSLINVRSNDGSVLTFRALLDQGSEVSFVTAEAVRRLGLYMASTPTYLRTVGSNPTQLVSRGTVLVNFDSRFNSVLSLQIQALVIEKITGNLPTKEFDMSNNPPELAKMRLADPQFGLPKPVDFLLGVEVCADVVFGTAKKLANGILAQSSALGWILSGRASTSPEANATKILVHHCGLCDLEVQLRAFWELEEIITTSNGMSPEELLCEKIYAETYRRNSAGRFVVRLIFKEAFGEYLKLGDSRKVAVSCFLRLEKRFAKSPELFAIYRDIIHELIRMNHMELVPQSELLISNEKSFYMPHHVVIRPSSTTTKYRVVFNASQKTSSGISLNNVLLTGPSLNNDLFQILLRFRVFKYAFMADLSKMYRQILVDEADCDYQRLVWRDSPLLPLRDYRLLTVSFGTSSAPYLALKTIRTLAENEKDRFPLASQVIMNDMYMDDVCSGTHDLSQLLETKDQLIELFNSACLELKKWCSNSKDLLNSLPLNYRENLIVFGDAKLAKVLGICWNVQNDEFRFRVNLPEQTKALEKISIPRWAGINPFDIFSEIHGFCDGSEKAYAAVVYLRIKKSDGTIKVTLLTAKTKVAPVKQISVPRLELCAALLLTRLMVNVQKSLRLSTYTVHAWTDSMVVLAYLQKLPCHWVTFIANRTTEILESIPSQQWHYVNTKENPADCASRGINPRLLESHPLWWNGPAWLKNEQIKYPNVSTDVNQLALETRKVSAFVSMVQVNVLESMHTKYSSFTKLIRITAWCLRYVENCRTMQSSRKIGFLSADELENALNFWIKVIQFQHFAPDILHLREEGIVARNSCLLSLNPFIDDKGVLRLGGRLRHSDLPESRKHPIILPKDDHFTRMLVAYYHLQTLHGNIQLLLNTLRMKYWILS